MLFEVTLVQAVLAAVIAVATGSVVVLAVLAVLEFARRMIASRDQADGADDPGISLPTWLLAAWFVGLLVATPLYTPYPRLVLPWLVAAWIAAGAAIAYWVDRTAGGCAPTVRRSLFRSLVAGTLTLGIVVGAAWMAERKSERGVPGWQDRSLLEQAAQKVFTTIRESADDRHAVIYVYAQPALVFHLNQLGANDSSLDIVAHPIAALDAAQPQQVPTFLVVDRFRSQRIPGYEQFIRRKFKSQVVTLPTLAYQPYRPSDLVLLNRTHPDDITFSNASSTVYLWPVVPDDSPLLRPPPDPSESKVPAGRP